MVRIADLGTLEGAVLLFGGPVSNLQATAALMGWADQRGIAPANRICTGDIAAYCGSPAETVALIRRAGLPVVAGNCERQLAVRASSCGCGFAPGTACDRLSAAWYAHADAALDDHARAWMAALPDRLTFRHAGRRWVAVHGGASDIARFLWPVSHDDEFWHEISLLQEEVGPIDVVLAGHSGIPFQRNVDGILWVNPGSVGLPPHDGNPETAFAWLDDSGAVNFESLSYDTAAAVRAMEAAGLTQGYERALVTGYWPSEDVLPASMRRQQPSRASG